ncbi:MAG: ATP-binding protein [Candidatus Spyradenecus sp.]
MKPAERYTITALRLINFHNFTNVTIPLPHGGHLFLLGDNGSGKTTVLDALHAILTGDDLDYNAAARIGAKVRGEGRRSQGIVMRLNTEARSEENPDGVLRPRGGITYAAMEYAQPSGDRHTCGIALEAHALDEPIRRYGFISSLPLDQLPLLVRDDLGERPADPEELREFERTTRGFHFYNHTQIAAYRTEIARRFFGSESAYADVKRLLADGKAYQTIVRSTKDYDERFRALLRPPDRETFLDVVEALRALHKAQDDKAAAEEELAALSAFERDFQAYHETLRNQSLVILKQVRAEQTQGEANLAATLAQLDETSAELRTLEDQRVAALDRLTTAGARLQALQQKDAEGLVGRAADARKVAEREEQSYRRCARDFRDAQSKTLAARTQAVQAADALAALLAKARKAPALQVPEALTLRRALEDGEADFPLLAQTQSDLRVAAKVAQNALFQAEAESAQARETEQNCAATCAQLAAVQAVLPGAEAIEAARQALQGISIEATPLYALLEPADALRPAELARLESLCAPLLRTLLTVAPADAPAARRLLFERFPELRLAVLDPAASKPEVAAWFQRLFHPIQSNPEAVDLLWRHLVAEEKPEAFSIPESALRGFTFRGVEARDPEAPPQWIGRQTRERFRERQRQAAQTALDQARRALTAAERALAQAQERVQAIEEAEKSLVALNNQWHEARAQAEAAQHRVTQCEAQSEACREAMLEAEDRRTQAVRLRDDLDARIQSAGLAGLNERIAKAQREARAAQEALSDLDQQRGRVQGVHASAESRRTHLLEEIAQREAQLHALCEGLALAPEAVAEVCAQVDETLPWAERAGELKAQLRQHASAPRLAHYGFIFDESANLVADRAGHPVSECLAEQQAAVAKTQRLVSDRLIDLNRQIFTEGFLEALTLQVKLMQQMARKARDLLAKRQFGNSRYSFSIEPREDYRALVTAITDPTAAGSDETLRAFIHSREADIIAAVSGDIPPDLDYRNWFRYRLKIQPLHGRAITVDNKTRSVGSGGEQAVPNYLLILTLAAFLYEADVACRLSPLLFDEAFYGIDAARRDELLAFAEDLGLQLFVASPDQDGLKQALHASTSLLVIKDPTFEVHVIPYLWSTAPEQQELAL